MSGNEETSKGLSETKSPTATNEKVGNEDDISDNEVQSEGDDDYEQLRLDRIKENQALLHSLGLAPDPSQPSSRDKSKRMKRTRTDNVSSEDMGPVRRSTRNTSSGKKSSFNSRNPEYSLTGRFGRQGSLNPSSDNDEMTLGELGTARRSTRIIQQNSGNNEDDEYQDREMERKRNELEYTRRLALTEERARRKQEYDQGTEITFEALFASMEGDKSIAFPEGKMTDQEWKKYAVDRWGPEVGKVECNDWEAYVTSRKCRPPTTLPSRLCYLQEVYCHDMWKLLCSLVLMSRVSSQPVKYAACHAFFARYTTPSSFVDADEGDVVQIIASLGLFSTRLPGLRDITKKFIEMPVFSLDVKGPNKIQGIGSFGYESWLMFTQLDWTNVSDKNLGAYAHMLRKSEEIKEKPVSVASDPPLPIIMAGVEIDESYHKDSDKKNGRKHQAKPVAKRGKK